MPAIKSASALVVDQRTGEILYDKNADEIAPIASITKLMTAMVVLDSVPDLSETIRITKDDVDTLRGSSSRLRVGAMLSREELLLLALMSSENRAAHALGRNYPGGLPAFVSAMNAKAQLLGLSKTRFADPTGLSSDNVSTARDLAQMVAAAHRYPLIRELSTTADAEIAVAGRAMDYRNTNILVKSDEWQIGLSKTGYIREAGKCLVMQAWMDERPTVIVLLDSWGRLTRIGDANRLKTWIESGAGARRADKSA
jgi:D-alanyl-D-alanine endopeptidase (penicillin-binding protein 7)